MKQLFLPLLLLALLVGCTDGDKPATDTPTPEKPRTPQMTFSVAASFPHDTAYYTEGLQFYNGKLLESTGLNGKSKLALYDLTTGKKDKELKLDDKFFGEGVVAFRDTIYQLTYQEGVVLVYDKNFNKIKELPYRNGEGWGLTHDSTYLIGTNSGNVLYYYQPGTFSLVKELPVAEKNGDVVDDLNELEYINGYIYANQWQHPFIYKIDPKTGEVVAKMDLSSIIQQERSQNPVAEVLNGIAYNPATKKFYVTGKNWSKIYELNVTL